MIAPPIAPPGGNLPRRCTASIKDTDNYIWTCEKSMHVVDEYNESTWHKDRANFNNDKNRTHMHTILYWCGNEEPDMKLW